mmetsp:Transcript_49338/g.77077  ORF Transcript_49338/g.77077 Transcript_49338/m.77077 type:complete len:123 (+) Transcript_49338:117-485(+)
MVWKCKSCQGPGGAAQLNQTGVDKWMQPDMCVSGHYHNQQQLAQEFGGGAPCGFWYPWWTIGEEYKWQDEKRCCNCQFDLSQTNQDIFQKMTKDQYDRFACWACQTKRYGKPSPIKAKTMSG